MRVQTIFERYTRGLNRKFPNEKISNFAENFVDPISKNRPKLKDLKIIFLNLK